MNLSMVYFPERGLTNLWVSQSSMKSRYFLGDLPLIVLICGSAFTFLSQLHWTLVEMNFSIVIIKERVQISNRRVAEIYSTTMCISKVPFYMFDAPFFFTYVVFDRIVLQWSSSVLARYEKSHYVVIVRRIWGRGKQEMKCRYKH